MMNPVPVRDLPFGSCFIIYRMSALLSPPVFVRGSNSCRSGFICVHSLDLTISRELLDTSLVIPLNSSSLGR